MWISHSLPLAKVINRYLQSQVSVTGAAEDLASMETLPLWHVPIDNEATNLEPDTLVLYEAIEHLRK